MAEQRTPPESCTGEAPGRVNLIGEHTDYHEGYVLPTVIPQRTYVTVAVRSDDRVRAHSAALGDAEEYRRGDERPGREWLDYVAGTTATLAADGVAVRGWMWRSPRPFPSARAYRRAQRSLSRCSAPCVRC